MGGFLAAIFMRGIPVLQIPTTLLAQVDAAIGGKTGVNLAIGKNLIGSFHQPMAVLIDPGLLGTLPEREYRAGLWEIVKAGVIHEPALFRYLAERSAAVLGREHHAEDRIIADSVRMKAEVVSADEREGDLRRILNFRPHLRPRPGGRDPVHPLFCTARPSPGACGPRSTWPK